MGLPLHLRGIASGVRRLASKGWTAAAIASAYHLTRADVRAIVGRLSPVHPVAPMRAIRGPLSRHVRILAERGESAERIGELLRLEPGHVAAFLARAFPPARSKTRRVLWRQPPRDWGISRGPEWRDDEDLVTTSPPAAAELLDVEPQIPPAMVGSEALEAMPVAASWGPFQESWPSGGKQGNARLSDASAVRIREEHAEGLSIAELAWSYGVSTATIKRVLAHQTYRDAKPPPDDAEEPPAIAEVTNPGPVPTTWEEPPRTYANAALTWDEAQEARALAKEGHTREELAIRFGVSRSTITKLLAGKTYTGPPPAIEPDDDLVILEPPAIAPELVSAEVLDLATPQPTRWPPARNTWWREDDDD